MSSSTGMWKLEPKAGASRSTKVPVRAVYTPTPSRQKQMAAKAAAKAAATAAAAKPATAKSTEGARPPTPQEVAIAAVAAGKEVCDGKCATRPRGKRPMTGERVCICMICTCHTHHCPPHRVFNAPYESIESEAHHRYKGVQGDPALRVKPVEEKPVWAYQGDFNGDTTNNAAYVGVWDVHKAPSAKHALEQPHDKQPFDGMSEHTAKYVPHPNAEPRKLVRGHELDQLTFDDDREIGTTNRDDFVGWWDVSKDPSAKAKADTVADKTPFAGTTTHQDDFIKHGNAEREPVVRGHELDRLRFDWGDKTPQKSTMASDYTEKVPEFCPVRGIRNIRYKPEGGHVWFRKDHAGKYHATE